MYSKEQIEQYKINSCDLCRYKGISTTSCCLCNKSSGLLKRIEYNHKLDWVHRSCLLNKNSYSFFNGLYIFHFCSETNCSKCLKNQIHARDDEEGECDVITTSVKCEVCLQVIHEITSIDPNTNNFNNNYSRCNSCLSWYHDRCELEYCRLNYINFRGKCIKCYKEPNFIKCCLCFNQGGLMVHCIDNNYYAHSLCILSFNTLFKKKRGNRIAYELIAEKSAIKEKKSQCCICNKVNQYTIECNTCKIRFHPYCAFKANFTLIKSNMIGIEFKCTISHLRYPKDVYALDKDNESNASTETSAHSFAANRIMNQINDTKVLKKDITEIMNTFFIPEKNKQKRKCKYRIKTKDKNSDNRLNHDENKQMTKFNWRQVSKFYRDFSKEDIEKAFPYSFYTKDQIYDLIKETANCKMKSKDILNPNDYILCNIKKSKTSYYILYKMLQLQIQDRDESTILYNLSDKDSLIRYTNTQLEAQNDIDNDTYKFLSKKTKEYSPYPYIDFQQQPTKYKAQFLRAFRLNSFSNRILSYENQIDNINLDEDFSYIDKQIIKKKEMLKTVLLSNIQTAKDISLRNSIDISSNDSIEAVLSEIKTSKSINNFKTLMKRLKEGIKDKAYSDLFYGDNQFQILAKQERDTLDYYDSESECCVCLAYCSYSSTHVIYCDNCNVSVHINCYGIASVPNYKFKCDLCTTNHYRNKEINCCFCLTSHGAMKKFGKSDWVHITCVLISKYAQFENYSLLDKPIWIKDYDRMVVSDNKENRCSLCNQSAGETFKCINCSNSYHFFCAYFKGFKLSLVNNTSNISNKIVSLNIIQCSNDLSWNKSERQFQVKLRKLIYQKE